MTRFAGQLSQALLARFVRNGTWQCLTLVLRRAFALQDDAVFTNDARMKAMPPSVIEAWRNPQADTRNRELSPDKTARSMVRSYIRQATVFTDNAAAGLLYATDTGLSIQFPRLLAGSAIGLRIESEHLPLSASFAPDPDCGNL